MGGITSGVGIFSGIDTQTLVAQLLQLEARPRDLATRRLLNLQTQQGAILDINSRLNTLQTAASAFRTSKTFQSNTATSTKPDVLTASANTNASAGSYSFLVDRLVTTQQLLTRGFADKSVSGLGAESFTFESMEGRLDRDTSLSELNGGAGVERGKIVITQGSTSATVDLSKSVTVGDVLDRINESSADVTASIEDGAIVLTKGAGSDDFTVANASGSTTATSLGIAQATAVSSVTGSNVYRLSDEIALSSLNDGNGIVLNPTATSLSRFDFKITIDGSTEVEVNLGEIVQEVLDEGGMPTGELETVEGRATSLGKVLERINTALDDEGVTDVTARISADGVRIELYDATGTHNIEVTEQGQGHAARDLGILSDGSVAGTVTGARILAGINGTLTKNLNGGNGIGGDGTLRITARDGSPAFDVDLSGAETIEQVIGAINDAAGNGGNIVASINETGTGLVLTDTTGGVGNLIVTGAAGDDTTAEDLGILTDVAGVASSTLDSGSLQHAYVTGATRLEDLNGGDGVGTGKIQFTDSKGATATVDIGTDTETVAELLSELNGQFSAQLLDLRARINDNGDGIIIEEFTDGDPAGTQAIKIADVGGSIAKKLRIAGEASGTDADNYIEGSYESTVEFETSDTLEDMVRKINEAGVAATATIINDGSGANPYRVSIVSRNSGSSGRFVLDTHGFDLGLSTLDEGQDSRVFFGSTDPAKAVLLTSSSNSLDSVITGVTIDLKSTSDDPVTLTVARNNTAIETSIEEFVTTFNDLVSRIDQQTRYDPETEVKGPLLGDSTMIALRRSLFNTLLASPVGVEGPYNSLADVGVSIGDGGEVTFDRDRFREAMAENPEAVEDLFTARTLEPVENEIFPGVTVNDPNAQDSFSSLGVIGQLEELAKQYVDSVDGVLTVKKNTLESQIGLQEARITAFTERLQDRRVILERQFLAMEQAIASLQTQQAALQSLG